MRPYARWADVFIERGAFDADEARTILEAARRAGSAFASTPVSSGGPTVCGSQWSSVPPAPITARSSPRGVTALAGGGTVATLLPGAEFSTRQPYPDARRLLDAGVTVAIATDCNPGSSYTTSMPFCIALAVRELRMSPYEALRAATLGGAAALRRPDVGHLRPGARADLLILDAPSYIHLAYRPGVPLIREVLVA